jgi:hypothetical protein
MDGKKIGRPTRYNEAMQEAADKYLNEWLGGLGKELGESIPSRVGLCVYLGISKSVSHMWEERHPEFMDTLKGIETLQEQVSLNGGMIGKYNPTITKLVLANHGYHDKQQVDNTSSDGSMKPPAPTYVIKGE